MSEANETPPATEAKSAAPNVIRIVHGSEETSQERLLKKQIPAWVVSGAFHVVILVALIVIGKMQPTPTAASESIAEVLVDKSEDEDKKVDLTNTDKGLDSELANALPVDRVEDVTVDAKVVNDQPVGNDVPDAAPTDAQALLGAGAGTELGVAGTDGLVMGGDKGAGGIGNSGFNGRSGATKEKSLMAGGGNKDSELAVARGLAWLDKKQNKANGNWTYDGTSKADTIAATGMGLAVPRRRPDARQAPRWQVRQGIE